MNEWLQQQLTLVPSREEKINRLRELLQILALKIMFDHSDFQKLAFVGGTALRILFGLRRYSEDLDFCLVKKQGYRFSSFLAKLKYELEKNGLEAEISLSAGRAVQAGFIKFPKLLNRLGLSPFKDQKLSIKVEVDSNPPRGGHTVLSPVTKSFVFAVNHFDLPSLYATKLHACFFRKYTKGRDFYDLVWYLGKKTEPNFTLLNNAVRQTEKKNFGLDAGNLKAFMLTRLARIDFTAVRRDVGRFLEDKNELRLLDKKIILAMVGGV